MTLNALELPLASIKHWMDCALIEAEYARDQGEVPVGAIIVKDGIIIGRGFNTKERDSDPTAHAEIVAIRNACHTAQDWRLDGSILISTLEPCPMCAGAIIHTRISSVIYGARDFKWGGAETKVSLFSPGLFNHNTQPYYFPDPRCESILTTFFKARRKKVPKKVPGY